jgi:hypothetical protein
VRWRVWKKTTKLLSVFGRHIGREIGQANLRVVAKEIRGVSLAVSSKFYQKNVRDKAAYKALTNKAYHRSDTCKYQERVGKQRG